MVYPLPGKSRWVTTVGTLVAVALALAQSRVNARLQSNPDSGPAPLSATRCPYAVASGDLNAGIQLVGDHSCAAGGIGCFENVCRYCKFTETPQSTAFLPCKNLGYDFGGSVAANAPANPVVTATSPAPIAVQPPSQPSSEPAPRPTPASNPATDCPYSVSAGDLAVGVLLVGDATCASGGLGCYESVCRYCKTKETPQSSHWVNCSSLGYPKTTAPPVMNPSSIDDTETNCPYPVPEADFADGIQLVGDATCAKGGRGCFQNVCRFCKFRNTVQSKHMVPCGDLGYPQFGTPVTDPASIGVGGCPYDVSDGDAAVGINLVGDGSCVNGGLGCFESVCRYCKVKDTPQSKHLLKCADVVASPLWKPTDVVGPAPAPAPATPPSVFAAPTSTSGTPTKHPSGVGGPSGDSFPPTSYGGSASSSGSGSGGLPSVGTYGNGNPPHDPFVRDSTKPPLVVGGGPTSCEGLAAVADLPPGITIVPDPSCSTSSPGCVRVAASACRYCMKVPIPIGQGLPLCDQLAPPVTDMPPQTQPIVDHPAPAVAIGAAPSLCEQIAANSDFPPGVSAAADPSCMTDDDIDCIHIANSACRVCKKVTTSFTQGLARCDKIKPPAVATKPLETPPIGDQPILPPTIGTAPTSCDALAAMANTPPEISVVSDPSCTAGVPGCVRLPNMTCRYCMKVPTTTVQGLSLCDQSPLLSAAGTVMGADMLAGNPPTGNQPGPLVMVQTVPMSCEAIASNPSLPQEIGVVPDPSCLNSDSMGCARVPNAACRFCAKVPTSLVQGLTPCDKLTPLATAVELASVSTSVGDSIDGLLKDHTFQWSIIAAACVGVVAAAALVALGAKRAVARRVPELTVQQEATAEEDEAMPSPEAAKPSRPRLTIEITDGIQEGSV